MTLSLTVAPSKITSYIASCNLSRALRTVKHGGVPLGDVDDGPYREHLG